MIEPVNEYQKPKYSINSEVFYFRNAELDKLKIKFICWDNEKKEWFYQGLNREEFFCENDIYESGLEAYQSRFDKLKVDAGICYKLKYD